MITFLFSFLLLIVLALYAYSGYVLKKQQVIPTEAGPLTHNHCVPAPYCSKPIYPKKGDEYLDMSKFIRTIVYGDCMKPKKLNNNDNVLVAKINNRKDILSQIEIGNVLLLYIPEKNLYKFRELDRIGEDGLLYTIYYDSEGKPVSSSKPHTQDMVLGVAKYKI